MGVGERFGMGPGYKSGTSSMCVGSCCLGVCWGMYGASTHDVIKVSNICKYEKTKNKQVIKSELNLKQFIKSVPLHTK